jgi:threonine/homoserine/homoserine lactone efflux protein
VGVGAMCADATFMLLTLLLGRFLPTSIEHILFLVGGIVMLYIAYQVWRSREPSERTRRGNFLVGLGMGLTNPFQITWWLTAGLFMIKGISLATVPGFFTGIIIWIFSFPFALNRIKTKYIYLRYVSTLIIGLFGIYMLYVGVLYLI